MSANVSKLFYPIILFNNEPKIKVDDLGFWNCLVPAVGFGEVARVASRGPSSIWSSAGGAGWVVGAVMIWSTMLINLTCDNGLSYLYLLWGWCKVDRCLYPILFLPLQQSFPVTLMITGTLPAVGFDEVAGVASWGPSSICSSARGAGWAVGAVMIWSN